MNQPQLWHVVYLSLYRYVFKIYDQIHLRGMTKVDLAYILSKPTSLNYYKLRRTTIS